jgi:RND family efflux transporter MFP subunit
MTDTERADLSRLRLQRDEPAPDDQKPRRRMGLLLYILGGVFMAVAVTLFLSSYLSKDEVVEVATVTMISPNQANVVLTASGYVVAQRKAAIASKATGRLVALNFEEGDRVKKGQVIGRIESADVEATLAQARADLKIAQSDFTDAERSLERARTLLDRSLISQAEFDAAQARHDRVVAQIAASNAAVQAAEVALENTYIRAPFDGTVLTKNADVGEVVAPFAAGASSRVAVVTMADMASLEVEADVSESNITRISLRQPCEITLDAYPDQRYQGFVHKIVPTADRAKATVLTKVRFVNRDERVLPEMSAKVHFLPKQDTVRTTSTVPVLAVDSAVIVRRNNERVSYVLRENRLVEEIPVRTGDSYGRMIEVKEGLARGDRVVIRPSDKIHSGVRVEVKDGR